MTAPATKTDSNRALYHLPHGEGLRILLSQPYITAGDLKAILRKRGVFVHQTDKTHLVPLLTTTLLSPSEFGALLECHITKEDRLKRKTRMEQWTSNRTLADAVPLTLDPKELILDEYANYRIIGEPSFKLVGNDPNHLVMEYEIEREDWSKGWDSSTTRHIGKVNIRKVVDGKRAIMILSHTATETKDVSNRIAAIVTKRLRESNDIDADSTTRRMLFGNFSNEQRIAFFWSLTGEQKDGVMTFTTVSDFDVLPVDGMKLPANLEWMQDRVSKMHIKGRQLHETFFIAQSEFHPFLLFHRMEAQFAFKYHAAEGQCTVVYEFAGFLPKKRPEAEFEAQITHLELGDDFTHVDKAAVKEFLQERIDQTLLESFDKMFPASEASPSKPGSVEQAELFASTGKSPSAGASTSVSKAGPTDRTTSRPKA